jgi:predicted TIM-barrel fold metal-dependent hydrolase
MTVKKARVMFEDAAERLMKISTSKAITVDNRWNRSDNEYVAGLVREMRQALDVAVDAAAEEGKQNQPLFGVGN